ncbi:hypothetical protein GJAV_G00188910 [Gymnothorax javanicus]|nr:hypothetical protein GJAV_G00188910 [Gymnothorax javanicus]
MAQGRVAHLIEWKGWNSGAGAEGAGYSWGGGGGSWGGAGVGLQVDDQLYCHLTDELKEARFAAGVVAQFALAEAAMCGWSSLDVPVDENCSFAPLQDPEGHYLSHFLPDRGDMDVSSRLYSVNMDPRNDMSLCLPQPQPADSVSNCPCQPVVERHPQGRRTLGRDGSIRHADSSSLSEDEVFYN